MKTIALLLSLLPVCTSVFSQTTIQGKVTDAQTAEPLIFCSVAIYQNGVLKTGTETDLDGLYNLSELSPGTYTVEFSYTGYQALKFDSVSIEANKTTKLDAKMSAGVTMEVVCLSYTKPLVEQDNTTQGLALTADQIKKMPTKNVNALAGTTAGATANGRGSRSDASNYYIDGVRVSEKTRKNEKPLNSTNPANCTSNFNTEDYAVIVENEFKSPLHEPLSTFSIDVDKASYANVRRLLGQNILPPPDAVRIEEMINYFDYAYEQPKDETPFSVSTELAPCLWNERNLLLHIGLKGKMIDMAEAPPCNLVFLLDVSGSMQAPNKLDLVKPAFSLLVNNLRKQDRVAIVVYAGAAGLVLPSTSGADKEQILSAIERMKAGGSTAGGEGIRLAYEVAKQNFIAEGNNRVILATDGDFNIGVSSDGDLTRLIESKRDDGIYFTCLGFGYGNYKDNKLEILADKGNGNYAYIDNLMEAKKTFVTDLTGTLFTIAKDVKIQVEFNPKLVEAYRLVGYENRLLNKEDFNDDTKDAGEIGAGHTVTALYEIVPKGASIDFAGKNVDALKYQQATLSPASRSGELLTLKLRYKLPGKRKSQLISTVVENRPLSFDAASSNLKWASTVAGFALMLRQSKFKGDLTFEKILASGKSVAGDDPHGYRSECLKLIETAKLLTEAAAPLAAEKK